MNNEKGIHKDKCRLCLCRLNRESDIYYLINEAIENRFETLTSLQLSSSNQLSTSVCASCDENLARFDVFREEMIKKQTKLNEILRENEETVLEEPEPEPAAEYLNEEIPENDPQEYYTEVYSDESQSQSSHIEEYLESDTDESTVEQHTSTVSSTSRKLSRPKAWEWTNEMEVDLIKYYKKYKTGETTNRYAFTKISKKFAAKGHPNISSKSIKYKHEKLLTEHKKLAKIEQNVLEAEDSDDVSDTEEKISRRKHQGKKAYWNESMEVSLFYLINQEKIEQPAISDSNLYRIIADHFQKAGFNHIFEHNICYHIRKLKKEIPERFNYFESKAKLLKEPFQCHSKNLWLSDTSTPQSSAQKRKYLHWTEDMKQALLLHREGLGRKIPNALIWTTVAEQMKNDGYGTFTPESVMHKYFNIKRQKINPERILN